MCCVTSARCGLLQQCRLRRLAFFVAVWLAVSALGLLIPGGQLLVAPVLTGFTIFFLPLDYASYTLDRRKLTFVRKRDWLLAHRGVIAGFGATSFALCVLPGVNLFATPVLVVAGTLLALRLPEPAKLARRPGSGREKSTSP